MKRRTLLGGTALAAAVVLVGAWALPTVALAASPVAADPAAAAVASSASSAFTRTETVSRTHLVKGVDQVVDTRTVTLSVAETANLRDRQGIEVTWAGARPTAGIVADPHSEGAAQEEYPMVLLQCRGVDSTTVPTAQQLRPETCWTAVPSERYNFSYSPLFPPWRVDRYASPADRTKSPGVPDPRPAVCGSRPPVERWLPFVGADGTVFGGGPRGCGGMPPEGSNTDSTTALPSNTTYAATGLDGTGSARFDIRDEINNGSLGCSATVACAIVAIPIMGISCDISAAAEAPADRPTGQAAIDATKECTKTGRYDPGSLLAVATGDNDAAVSGSMWWSASNWQHRITVPITMAPSGSACSLSTSGKKSADIYGSEVLTQATTSWLPTFCLDPAAIPVKHVAIGEPQARNLLATAGSQVWAAFTTQPRDGGYGVPVVHTPVAVSGFAITYAIDDAHGDPYTKLRLTPRLLAKLLTMSYPGTPFIQRSYQALSSNPLDISLDPEFQALNPGIKKGVAASISASTIYSTSADSDLVYALTSYIWADGEARAWLQGSPDPWGMRVNPTYVRRPMPVNSWPLLDDFEPKDYYAAGVNPCLQDAPVPWLPLVAAPTQRLATISLAMQYAIAQSQVICVQPYQGSNVGQKLAALGRQTGGYRFLIGITSLGDAARYGLDSAALQTQVGSGSGSAFTDGSGRSFAAPTDAGLKAAAALITPSADAQDWKLPYDTLAVDPKGVGAYPGTMLVSADVPTSGLPSNEAAGYAAFLRFVAGAGQTPGLALGQLPPGYLPMTKANGLGVMADYTARAAVAVAEQKGAVPPLVAPVPTATPAPSSSTPAPTTTGSGSTTTPAGNGATPGVTSSMRPTSSTPAKTTPAPTVVAAKPVSLGKTALADPGLVGLAIPALLALGALAAVTAGFALFTSREDV